MGTLVVVLVAVIAAVVLALITAYHVIFRRPLPRTEGRLVVDGLHGPVEINRDVRGVPHVSAVDRHDACFAVGFLHAQDRLWQMEVQRRLAAGRLSEVVGPQALEADRLTRRLGLRRVSEAEWHVTHAAGEVRKEVLAYTAGVNAGMRDRPLPAEFTILRHRPEPWEPEDTLAVGRLLTFSQAGNWEAQLVRMRMLKELGPELTQALDPVLSGGAASMADLDGAPGNPSIDWLEDLQAAEELLSISAWAPASNSWAVHGSRTATGAALLANDPHAPIGIPSPWYRVHVRAGDDELAGLTFCGGPHLLFGRNRRVAWGLVNANVSTQDLYVERFNPNNPLQFDDRGHWEDAVRFREVIRVRGAQPEVEDVLVTRRGPIISPAVGGTQPPMSLRWVGLDSEVDSVGWVMRLNRAADWKGFRAAISSCASPALGVTYADVEGNIGYRLSGFIPLRRRGQGRVPSRGWAPEDEWQGFIGLEEMPELHNPADGLIVAANQPVALETCPHGLVAEPAGELRAARIRRALEQGPVSVETSGELQADVVSTAAERFRALVLDVSRRRVEDRPAAAIEVLRAWDCRIDLESGAAALYELTLTRLFDELVGPRLSPALRRHLLGAGATVLSPDGPYSGRLTSALLEICAANESSGREPGALWRSLGGAWADLIATQGPEPARWSLRPLRAFELGHVVADAAGALRPILSRGPFYAPGDADTVRVGSVSGGGPRPGRVTAAFYRAVYDLGGRGSGWMHVPGQSGHSASPNYADLTDAWLRGELEMLPFGEAPVGSRRLVLEPPA